MLLANTDDGRHAPEQKNACGRTPADPQHEQAHDAGHHQRLVTLRVVLLTHLHQNHGQERSAGEDHHQDKVGNERAEALSERAGRRHNQVGDQVVELVAFVRTHVVGHFAQNLEQSNEDRHLQQHGQAAGQGVELRLSIQLLHFLLHARGIVGEFRLNLLHQRLNLLHLIRRLRLLVHEGRNYQSEDDGHDDDGQAPVLAEAEEELDNVKYPVLEYFPHTMDFLPLVDKSRRLRARPPYGTGS